eukprot:853536_1
MSAIHAAFVPPNIKHAANDIPEEPQLRIVIIGYLRALHFDNIIINELCEMVYLFVITPQKYQAKISLIGPPRSGKTSILFKLLEREYTTQNILQHQETFTKIFETKSVKLNDYLCMEFEIWYNWAHSHIQ